jgi:hypothetical protein
VRAAERTGDLLDIGEREPKLIAAGNDDAMGVENAQPGERDLLGLSEDGLQAPPDPASAGSGACAGGRPSGRGGRISPPARSRLGSIGVYSVGAAAGGGFPSSR